jgi:hypothetical protein
VSQQLRRHVRPILPAIFSVLLLLAALLAAGAEPGFAADNSAAIPKPPALRIASFDVRGAAIEDLAPAASTKKPAWRTTFGSERRNAAEKSRATHGPIDADVVLLQGVTAIRPVRKLFPANDWKLIVSRQMLDYDDDLGLRSRDALSSLPTTAVAVRYQAGWRVMGQEHLLGLASPAADGLAMPRPAAGTAVRVNVANGPTLWFLSLDLSPLSCAPDEPQCQRPKAIETWIKAKASAGGVAVLGGRTSARPLAALPQPPCVDQVIETIPPPGGEQPQRTAAVSSEQTECMAAVTLPVP